MARWGVHFFFSYFDQCQFEIWFSFALFWGVCFGFWLNYFVIDLPLLPVVMSDLGSSG